MARADARPRLHGPALEAFGGARVDHLLGPALNMCDHLLDAAYALWVVARLEGRWPRLDLAALDLAALSLPFLQAAVEDAHIGMTIGQEHPPRPGSSDPAAGIIDHDGVGIAD